MIALLTLIRIAILLFSAKYYDMLSFSYIKRRHLRFLQEFIIMKFIIKAYCVRQNIKNEIDFVFIVTLNEFGVWTKIFQSIEVVFCDL